MIPRVLRWRAVWSYLSHSKPGIGFEFGNRLLKLEFKFGLFLLKVVGRFRHDPNGTLSGPGIRFTMLVERSRSTMRGCTLGDGWAGRGGDRWGHGLNLGLSFRLNRHRGLCVVW